MMEKALKQATSLSLTMVDGLVFFMLGFGLSYKNNFIGDGITFLLKCFDFIVGYSAYYLSDLYSTSFRLLSQFSFDLEIYDDLLFQLSGAFLVIFASLLILATIIKALKSLFE